MELFRQLIEELLRYWYSYNSISFIFFLISILCNISHFCSSVAKKYRVSHHFYKFAKYIISTICATIMLFFIYTEYINPSIHYKIALKFYNGDGFSTDIETSILAFEKAISKNNIEACHILSDIYMAQDNVYKALQCLKTCINHGDSQSAIIMAEIYSNHIFTFLSKQEKNESAYLAYSQALCLGDTSVHQNIKNLQTQVPQSIKNEAISECKRLKAHLGR